jgi:hypothetical protein
MTGVLMKGLVVIESMTGGPMIGTETAKQSGRAWRPVTGMQIGSVDPTGTVTGGMTVTGQQLAGSTCQWD